MNWRGDKKFPASFIVFFMLVFFFFGEQLIVLPTYLGIALLDNLHILDKAATDALHRPIFYFLFGLISWLLFRYFNWPIVWLGATLLWVILQWYFPDQGHSPVPSPWVLAGVGVFVLTPFFIYRWVDQKWGAVGRRKAMLVAAALNLVLLGFFALQIFVLGNSQRSASQANQSMPQTNRSSPSDPGWQLTGDGWQPTRKSPPCPEPLVLEPPADLDSVSSILYPGQPRGPEFKAHGGFRYTPAAKSKEVRIPFDAQVVRGSRLVIQNEVQYAFEFIAPCGIQYHFGHLRTLTPKFQAIIDNLGANDERSPYASLTKLVEVQTG